MTETIKPYTVVFFHGNEDYAPGFAQVLSVGYHCQLEMIGAREFRVLVDKTYFTPVKIPDIPVSGVGQSATYWTDYDDIGEVVWMSEDSQWATVRFTESTNNQDYMTAHVGHFHRVIEVSNDARAVSKAKRA